MTDVEFPKRVLQICLLHEALLTTTTAFHARLSFVATTLTVDLDHEELDIYQGGGYQDEFSAINSGISTLVYTYFLVRGFTCTSLFIRLYKTLLFEICFMLLQRKLCKIDAKKWLHG